jgi:hypothetical protein
MSLVGLAPGDPMGRAGRTLWNGNANGPNPQQQTFGLIQRFAAMFRAWRFPAGGPIADTDPSTYDDGSPAQMDMSSYEQYFKTEQSRLQVYEDADEMDATTDEVAAALDTLSDSSVNPEDGSDTSFEIEIDEGPYRDAAEAVFAQVSEALDLQSNAMAISREMLLYGDCYFELVLDDYGRLARGKILPAKSIWRNEDSAGNLMQGIPVFDEDGKCQNKAGECAFDQRDGQQGTMLAAFDSWQIAHFRWNRKGSSRYGRSMLSTARVVWKKLKAAEEAVVIARLQRAWMRFVHKIDTTGMSREDARAAIRDYRTELTRRYLLDTQSRENPLEVTSDFYIGTGYTRDLDGNRYIPRLADITILQGDHAALAVMTDVEYFQNKLFASLRVPKAYLGFERDVNAKATLTTQDIQFARVLRRIQSVLSTVYKEIFDLGLILAGINPTDVHYRVRWPVILVSDEERDAQIRMMHARADSTYWQMGAPSTRWFVQQRFGLDDEAWEADLLDALNDPPSRIKIPNQEMSPQAQSDGAQTIGDALAAAQGNGGMSVSPVDQYPQGGPVDPSWAQPTVQQPNYTRAGSTHLPTHSLRCR